MSRPPLALELYSVRNELKEDTAGTLKAVAEMGYEGVEFAGPPNNSAEELKGYLDDLGLPCCGWHTPFALVQDDKPESTIELNKTMNNEFVIIPGLPGAQTQTRDAWLKTADFFDGLADKLADHGLATGYHNHHREFTPWDESSDETAWDTLFGNTKDSVVMELDTGNAISGGGDAVAILKKYPGRSRTTHLKPFHATAAKEDRGAGFRPIIGDDTTDWPAVLDACENGGGTEWYIVEYESDAFPPLEAVARCLKALKAMGK
jgi:sugar phosphate isomerase/epimerase